MASDWMLDSNVCARYFFAHDCTLDLCQDVPGNSIRSFCSFEGSRDSLPSPAHVCSDPKAHRNQQESRLVRIML